MPRPSSLTLAKSQIHDHFASTGAHFYTEAELEGVLLTQAAKWHLVKSTRSSDFIAFLLDHNVLKAFEFRADSYDRRIIRYAWGSASPYALALSLNARGYLSHGTAAKLHHLINVEAKTLYLNVEQSPKTPPRGGLTQSALDQAFARKQRQSNFVFRHGSHSVTIIAGKNTGRLGVKTLDDANSAPLKVTDLERTLIDITVRPAYAGGVREVLNAYRAARERISAKRILNILDELAYVYPYHQAIGFFMQAAGYDISDALLARPREYDFYLAHGIIKPLYSKKWRIYYPRDLKIPLDY